MTLYAECLDPKELAKNLEDLKPSLSVSLSCTKRTQRFRAHYSHSIPLFVLSSFFQDSGIWKYFDNVKLRVKVNSLEYVIHFFQCIRYKLPVRVSIW